MRNRSARVDLKTRGDAPVGRERYAARDMMQSMRFLVLFTFLVPFLARAAEQRPAATAPAPAPAKPQIQWQRDLEDALTLAKTENRPLLIAINLDGESASDRIVI